MKDNSLADVAWGLGFILLAGITIVRGNDEFTEYARRTNAFVPRFPKG